MAGVVGSDCYGRVAGVVGSDCYGEWLVSWGVTVMESGWCRGE